MTSSGWGAAWTKAIVVQVVIVAGVLFWVKFYVPRMGRARAAAETAERERKIEAFAQFMIVEDASREVKVTGEDGATPQHPQQLRNTASPDEVQQALGAPTTEFTDFGGGQHLTWTATTHQLEVAFVKGHLYSLRFEDLHTGHGVMVYESSLYWQQW
jgi:hypothetical protein